MTNLGIWGVCICLGIWGVADIVAALVRGVSASRAFDHQLRHGRGVMIRLDSSSSDPRCCVAEQMAPVLNANRKRLLRGILTLIPLLYFACRLFPWGR